MSKTLLIFFLIFSSLLLAKEPTMGILKSVNSNTKQLFSISNFNFECNAYGIIGIDSLAQRDELGLACKEKIESFYRKNPESKYFSELKLHTMQMYHIDFKKKECVLFARGEVTLGELLLRDGLAVLQANFDDREYFTLYTIAQKNAKIEKKGLWKDGLIRDCVGEIYKK